MLASCNMARQGPDEGYGTGGDWPNTGGGYDESGESHFTVEIEAPRFAGMNRLARQRAVNEAVGDLINRGHVHALAIRARAPGE